MSEFFYLLCILIAYSIAVLAEKTNRKRHLFVLIILLSIFSGFRGAGVGIDTSSYYNNIRNHFPYRWMFKEEGFRFVSNTIMNISNNPQIVFVICALITNTLILVRLWDYKEKAKFGFMVLLYLLLYYSNSMNIMRQYVAVALVFFGTRYLFRKQYQYYIIFCFLAFLFHRSALLGVGYLAISIWGTFTKRQKKLFFIPTFSVIILSVFYVMRYLATDISSYLDQKISNLNIPYFYRVAIFAFVIWFEYVYRTKKTSENSNYDQNKKVFIEDKSISVFYFVGLMFSSLSLFFAFVGRTGLYYMLYEPIFWGIITRKAKNRRLYTILILVLAFYEFVQVFSRNSCGIFPYYLGLFKNL